MRRAIPALLAIVPAVVASGCAAGFDAGAEDITPTSATLVGVVGSDRTERGTYSFSYAERSGAQRRTATRTIQFSARRGERVSEPVTGLAPATLHELSVCADDQQALGPFCSAPRYFATRALPGQDSVTGVGTQEVCDGIFYSTAHSGPNGESPAGHGSVCGVGNPFEGRVVCLRVLGNVAVLKQTLDFGAGAPSHVDLRITDNGSSGDTVAYHTTSASGCEFVGDDYFDAGFSGDLHVTDAQPASR